jgi:beta-ribofuranosylaminobenzene 5'-phosphate synthase
MVTVETGARLHFGFQNLALAHDRLYGGIGIGLDDPYITVEAMEADGIRCSDTEVEEYVEAAVDVLGVPGADITVHERFDRHVGLGSGTQIALACLVGIAEEYDQTISPRDVAPELGRGGRSGVGVATFEEGGFVIDGGHRTAKFTTRPPDPGNWTVPEPIVQETLPEGWRFLLVTPDVDPGCSGPDEDANMQSAVEGANPGIADDIAAAITRSLLPAVAERDVEQFGKAVERIGRLNGAWYADEQGGVYRPPAGTLIAELRDSPALAGTGQSSWGPTVYGVTDDTRAVEARESGEAALEACGLDGTVRLVCPGASGYSIEG